MEALAITRWRGDLVLIGNKQKGENQSRACKINEGVWQLFSHNDGDDDDDDGDDGGDGDDDDDDSEFKLASFQSGRGTNLIHFLKPTYKDVPY